MRDKTVDAATFEGFVVEAEPRLRRGLVAALGPELGRDAAAEALAWAWVNWEQVESMANPVGYLYRVGQSRSRSRAQGLMPTGDHGRIPEFEPGLEAALNGLSEQQRAAVVLVHGCEWTYQEVAEALGIAKSSVGTHLSRAMDRLRKALEVDHG